MARTTTFLLLAAIAAASLSACSDTKRPLETAVNTPDAYTAYRPADLNLPPDFARRPTKEDARTRASSSLRQSARFGRGRGPDVPADWQGMSRGTQAMLFEMNAQDADDKIRDHIDADTTIYANENKDFADGLLFGNLPQAPAESKGSVAVSRKNSGLIGRVF